MDCIEVSTRRTNRGYGQTYVQIGPRSGYHLAAHRIAFERAWSIKLKPGLVVRHTCDNPGCVNPLHLQLGTPKDNSQDMVVRGRHVSAESYKTHCLRGHEFTKENTYITSKGSRQCKSCESARSQRRKSRS